MTYQANSVRDIIFHTRLAMADYDSCIAVFHDNRCVGLWEDDSEPEPDGEGGWVMPKGYYVLRRPGGPMAGYFNALARQFGGQG